MVWIQDGVEVRFDKLANFRDLAPETPVKECTLGIVCECRRYVVERCVLRAWPTPDGCQISGGFVRASDHPGDSFDRRGQPQDQLALTGGGVKLLVVKCPTSTVTRMSGGRFAIFERERHKNEISGRSQCGVRRWREIIHRMRLDVIRTTRWEDNDAQCAFRHRRKQSGESLGPSD